mgnify:FL=1
MREEKFSEILFGAGKTMEIPRGLCYNETI